MSEDPEKIFFGKRPDENNVVIKCGHEFSLADYLLNHEHNMYGTIFIFCSDCGRYVQLELSGKP